MKRRVLFLCTGNSARSVLAEATLRAWAGHRFEVFSAGSQPTGTVNPFALGQLAAEGIATAGLRSSYESDRRPGRSWHQSWRGNKRYGPGSRC